MVEQDEAAQAGEEPKSFVGRSWTIAWIPGLVVSEMSGSLHLPPSEREEDIDSLKKTIIRAIEDQGEGKFVSLIDVHELSNIHPRWAPAMLRMFLELPRAPYLRGLVTRGGALGKAPLSVLKVATGGKLRSFRVDETDELVEWLASAGTCSQADVRRLWGR